MRSAEDGSNDSPELRIVKSALQSSEARFRRLVERLGERFLLFSHTADEEQKTLYVSSACASVFGFPPEHALNNHWAELISWNPGVVDRTLAAQNEWLSSGRDFFEIEMSFRHPDGSERIISVFEYYLEDESGRIIIEGIIEDITAQRQNETALEHLATHDDLTWLFSRNVLTNKLADEIYRAKRYQRSISVLLIDLDRFKQINDTYGHAKGDEVLIGVASAIQKHTRAADFGVRLGGDEFVVVLPEIGFDQATHLAGRIAKSFSMSGEALGVNDIGLSASIGVATYPTHGTSPEALLERADAEMYQVKPLR